MATRTEDRKVPTAPAAGSDEALMDIVLGNGERIITPIKPKQEGNTGAE